MKRTFIALHIHPNSKLSDFFVQCKDQFKHGRIKWVNPENLHLTLSFLGESEPSQIESVSKSLSRDLQNVEKFVAHVSGFGCFPDLKSPRVLWVGMGPLEPISRLKVITDTIAKAAGFETDRRKFHPHLTMGRPKWIEQPGMIQEYIDKCHGVVFQESLIDEVTYFESILSPGGAVYKAIKTFPLS